MYPKGDLLKPNSRTLDIEVYIGLLIAVKTKAGLEYTYDWI